MSAPTQFESLSPPARREMLANAVAVTWFVVCVAVVGTSSANAARLSLFASPDIALVSVACTLPLGLLLAYGIARQLDAATLLVTGVVVSACSIGLIVLLSLKRDWSNLPCGGVAGYVVRPLTALILTWPGCWMWTVAYPYKTSSPPRLWPWILTTLVLTILLPGTYVVARCRQETLLCQDLLAQSRVGEASVVLHRLRWLAPATEIQGQPVARVAANTDRTVRQLREATANAPSPHQQTVWLQRARQLAMLGEHDAALRALNVLRRRGPAAKTLAGTIHETREEWQLALQNYTTARGEWEINEASDARTAGRIQTTTGIAYCLRKQGKYAEAEYAYLQLLELSPTADTHFLLAQFYEDTQQTSLARQHVRRAIEMNPQRYSKPGKQLLNKLTIMHFGCFSVRSE